MLNKNENTHLAAEFKRIYGMVPDGIAQAPGRVNLIGEHTDYNDGFVLPCALQFNTCIAFTKRTDGIINVKSLSYPNETESFSLEADIVQGDLHWGDYIRAVAFVLKKAGHTLTGFDMLIDTTVPQGCGLSSSAALEVALGGLFSHANQLGLSQAEIAVFGQQSENDFVGCQSGIMDQLVSASGKKDHALLLDCRSLRVSPIAIPQDLVVVIVNSNYPRKLVGSEYNVRRADCESAAKKLTVGKLRDADVSLLEKSKSLLSENEYKRAKHVITENTRVLEFAEALKNNDISTMGKLMAASHLSMRDDFEITVPAIDGLVEICSKALGNNGGSRMTGGGFGGAVVCVCRKEDVSKLTNAIDNEYESQFALQASIYVCTAGNGLNVQDYLRNE